MGARLLCAATLSAATLSAAMLSAATLSAAMLSAATLSAATLCALAAPAAAAPSSIKVAARAQVRGTVVRLGDVASLKGFTPEAEARYAAIDLGRAPAPGLGKLLPKAWLEARIREAGVAPGVALRLPARLEVRRRTTTLKGSELERRVRKAIEAAMPHEPANVAALDVPRLSDLLAPAGAELSITFAPGETFTGTVTAELRVMDGGELIRTQRVNVRVDDFAQAWGVAAPTAQGQRLTSADLVPLRLPRSRVPRDAILDAASIDAAQLRRSVKPGEALRAAWVKVPPLVKRGDRVRMVAHRGGIELTATGEALAAGGRGDNVRVRNLDSQRVVGGRVIAPNTVEMEF